MALSSHFPGVPPGLGCFLSCFCSTLQVQHVVMRALPSLCHHCNPSRLLCMPFLHCTVIATLQRVVVHALPLSCRRRDPSTHQRACPSFIAPLRNPSMCHCVHPSFIAPLLRPFTHRHACPSLIAPLSQPFNASSCASLHHRAAVVTL